MVQASVLSEQPQAIRPARLLVLASQPKGRSPGQRFRLEQWAPRVAATDGIDLDFAPFESPQLTELLHQQGRHASKAAWVLYDFARRLRTVVDARRYDGVVIFREASMIGPALYERVLARAGIPLFYDFDDAIWLPSLQVSPANGAFSKLHFYGKTSKIIGLTHAVLAGNDYLADFARNYNPNVYVVPTSIELDRYPLQPEAPAGGPFVIAWSGSLSTLVQFETARPALEALAKKRPITMKIICNRPLERPIAGAENIFVPWSESREVEELGAAHVGVMPLPDQEFTRGKCGLKALQFMSAGRPVVVSPVGMNTTLIRDGQNGFLAGKTEEWVDVLDRLASSPELRRRVGDAGRKTVETKYSAKVVSKLFAGVVRSTLDAHRSRARKEAR